MMKWTICIKNTNKGATVNCLAKGMGAEALFFQLLINEYTQEEKNIQERG
jgi:hypothetical protein